MNDDKTHSKSLPRMTALFHLIPFKIVLRANADVVRNSSTLKNRFNNPGVVRVNLFGHQKVN